jgi:hypothetical protein
MAPCFCIVVAVGRTELGVTESVREAPVVYLKFGHYAFAGLVLATMGTAQSRPGVSFDQTIHSVTLSASGIDTANTEMHMTAAGGDARIDVKNGKIVENMGPFSPGLHAVMIMRDSGREMVFLNPDQKQYLSIKPVEMMQGMQKMLESMGGSMTVDTSVTRVSLDSLGPGPTIDGHPTLKYRLTAVMRMTMSMNGERNVLDNQSTQDIQTAIDLGDFSDLTTGVNRFTEFSQTMGFPKGYLDKLAATHRKMRGFPLLSVKHSTISVNGTKRTAVETMETRNIKRVTVPDSLFVIPGDYKPVAMPGMPGTGTSSRDSLRHQGESPSTGGRRPERNLRP